MDYNLEDLDFHCILAGLNPLDYYYQHEPEISASSGLDRLFSPQLLSSQGPQQMRMENSSALIILLFLIWLLLFSY